MKLRTSSETTFSNHREMGGKCATLQSLYFSVTHPNVIFYLHDHDLSVIILFMGYKSPQIFLGQTEFEFQIITNPDKMANRKETR